MAKLEKYGDLTKKQKDLFKLHYCFGTYSIFTLNSVQDPLSFNFRASSRDKGGSPLFLSSVWLQYKHDKFSFKEKIRSVNETSYIVEFTPKDIVPNLKVKTDCKVLYTDPQKVTASTSAEYACPKFVGKLGFNFFPMSVDLNFTTGKPNCGIGVDTRFDMTKQRFSSYNTSFWWFKKFTRLVVRLEGNNPDEYNLGNVVTSFYRRVSKEAHFASLVKFNWQTKTAAMEFGTDYQYDSQTLVKAKGDSNGLVSLALNRKLSPALSFSGSVQVDTNKIASNLAQDYKLGFRLDMNLK